jgi:hypothetical protein
MIITRQEWDQITEPSSAAIVENAVSSLAQGIRVVVKSAGQPPYREFTSVEQFEQEYRKKLRNQGEE